MRVIINEEYGFNEWILENFESEEEYFGDILEFKGLDFFNLKDGFLGFRFSIKRYFIWAMNMFGIKEISVNKENNSVTYSTNDKNLIVEFSYKNLKDNRLDSLILKIKDKYFGGRLVNTYHNFRQLMQDASEIVADILVEKFPDRFNVRYSRDFNGNLSVEAPEIV